MRVYVRQSPQRTVLLATSRHVLSFRSVEPQGPLERRATVVVEFLPRASVDLTRTTSLEECFGCLGLINVGSEVFICVITQRSRAATPTPQRNVWNIHNVSFVSLSRDYPETDETDHPCLALRKFVAGGGFLYASDFDLTAPIEGGDHRQRKYSQPADSSFMWNRFMTKGLENLRERLSHDDQQAIDEGGFLATLIRGFASSVPVQIDNLTGVLTILSRQSWLRAGTRFNSRGIDDDGNVANFVETETVLWLRNGLQFGFLQLRGSVPMFWEQDAQLIGAKIQITRSSEAAEPAFKKHFDNLFDRFGAVHIVDLLGSSTGSRGSTAAGSGTGSGAAGSLSANTAPSVSSSAASVASAVSSTSSSQGVGAASEADLSLRYQHLVEHVPALRYTHFDFHKEVAGVGYSAASKLVDRIQDSMLEFGFYSYNPLTESNETEQIGVFRVNCLDCLDRTNLVQQLISKDALDLFLDYHRLYASQELWNAHATLWADNGDQLSQNYTGTGALKSSYTRSGRMNLAGALSDVTKSVGRLYINNFVDKSRQNAIDEILGRAEGQVSVNIFDPINDHVHEEMKQRTKEYLSDLPMTVFAATFNVNGKTFDRSRDDISAWLFPPEISEKGIYPDVYMIGFQELVELTTSQILNVDPSRKAYWEEVVGDCLNSRNEHYVLLRSGQLVGTAIMLFVKRSEMNNVTEVEGASKKTALGGITGNKGGVALGFKYGSTRFMFVNAHLAAGMHNVEDRHNDYKLLSNGLRLSGGRRIKDVDVAIWLGDFNYRIDLPNETVRRMMEQKKRGTIERLLEHDQLIHQMERGETFPYFNEAKIDFMPTYKFDPGTSTYDTSDKARVPAWTDRILVRGSRVKQLAYNSVSEVMFSDHRPVYAIYEVTASVLDERRADQLFSQLYDKRRDYLLSNDDKLLLGGVRSKDGNPSSRPLPYPSSETQKWWAGEGLPSKVPIVPPRPNMVLNPEKVNPFGSNLADFVPKPQPPPRPSPRASPSPQLDATRDGYNSSPSPSLNQTRHTGHAKKPAPPVPAPRSGASSSTPSLMDAPISDTPLTIRKSSASFKSAKSENSSLIDSDDAAKIPYKSLI